MGPLISAPASPEVLGSDWLARGCRGTSRDGNFVAVPLGGSHGTHCALLGTRSLPEPQRPLPLPLKSKLRSVGMEQPCPTWTRHGGRSGGCVSAAARYAQGGFLRPTSAEEAPGASEAAVVGPGGSAHCVLSEARATGSGPAGCQNRPARSRRGETGGEQEPKGRTTHNRHSTTTHPYQSHACVPCLRVLFQWPLP